MKGSLALAALLHEIQAAGPSGSGSGVAQVGNLTEPTTHNSSTEHKAGSEAKLCEVLKDEHGEWTGSVHPGGLYVLTCSRGYQVDGHSQVNMTCSRHAEWPAKPWCEAVDDCEKLLYKCGPAGLCHDLQDGVECMCERGAERSLASNGEAVCHFQGTTDCGGRNCGSHGVCVHLKEYQNTFDTGNSSFRCSCERGYMDDGEKCVAADCGPLQDPFGIWHGSHAYLGEYTLECHDDAFVWGGTEQAATISCPSFGRWRTVPRCLSPLEERREAERERISFVFHVCASVVCIVSAALAAGLTMGLVSLEPVELQIIEAARLDDCTTEKEKERLQKQKDAAKRILPLLKDHHLLLVTLLLLNALANEALPIFLDDLLSPVFAVLLSVTFVLICGEILPSAVFTGPAQLTVSASFIPVVKILLTTMYCIAKPIARMLDEALVHNREERFSRPEVRSVLRLHSPSGHQAAREAYREREGSAEGSPGGQSCLSGSRSAAENQLLPSEDPPQPPSVLNDLEVDLCMAVLMLGDTLVADSPAFYTLKRCARRVMPADFYSPAISVAADAVSSNKDFVVVFPNIDNVEWPVEVTWEEIVGILRTSELLATQSCTPIGSLCKRKQRPARIEAHETAADALAHIADACESPCGIGVVHRNDDFFGIFDGEDALCGAIAEQEEFAVPCTPSDRLSRQRREAGLGIVQSRSDASPSSSTGSPARETIPESAHLTGRTLGEIASMALEPVDEKEVRDRFHTDPQPDVVRGISLPLPSRSTSSAMDVVKSMSYSVGSPAAPSELEENQRQTHPADIAPGQTPLERSRPRPAQLSSELELTVPLQVLSEGTEVPEVPPTVPDTAPVPEEERDLEEISLGSRPSQGPFSGGQE